MSHAVVATWIRPWAFLKTYLWEEEEEKSNSISDIEKKKKSIGSSLKYFVKLKNIKKTIWHVQPSTIRMIQRLYKIENFS